MAQLRRLFQPGNIGGMELKNRLVMAPMATWSHDADGFVQPRTLGYYQARACGGVGLIICQSAVVLPEARAPGRLAVWDDKFIPGLASVASAIHAGGGKGAIQITHHGTILTQHKKSVKGPPEIDVVGASPAPWVFNNEAPREASQKDIDHLVNGLSEAARRVRDAGFDAVEIGGAHGYLVAQFLSARTNRRNDAYGGTPERRARFACEVVSAIKARAGRNFPVIFRMSADEFIAGGITIEEARIHAALVTEAGADALHVSAGCVDTAHLTNPCYLYPDALFADLSWAIKQVVKAPVMAVGKILEPSLAERLLEEGKADFIAMGRALLADPDLPRKAEQGKPEDINRCIYCNNCWDLQWRDSFKQRGLSCTVNPSVLRETDFDPRPAAAPKRVLVLGGGI
ncbi:MAG: NADH:flavin oxidoreductase, partial [Dehalococcoidia bacterium]|nr:NADH:flavin oxidoreductase [Dehalococcoidia bacterium]